MEKSKFHQAASELEEALKLEPQGASHKAQILTKLCQCYEKTKRQKQAIRACSSALELDGDNLEALLLVRSWTHHSGDAVHCCW